MGTESNKTLIRTYFDHFEKHELDEALAMLSDDVVWWIVGKPDLYPNAGVKSKTDMARIFGRVDSFLQNWVKMTIHSMIAEGERVAVEVESNAVANSGKLYNNTFSFFFVVRDGKIVEVREYFDIMHAAEIFRH